MIAHADDSPWGLAPRASGPSVPVLAWAMFRQQRTGFLTVVPLWWFGLSSAVKIPASGLDGSISAFDAAGTTCMWASLVFFSLTTPHVEDHYAHLPVSRARLVRAIQLLWTALLLVPLAFRPFVAPQTVPAWTAATAMLVGPGWTRRIPDDGVSSAPWRRVLLGVGMVLTLWAPDPVLAMSVGALVATAVGPWLDPPAQAAATAPAQHTAPATEDDAPFARPDDRTPALFVALLRRGLRFRLPAIGVALAIGHLWVVAGVALLGVVAMFPLRVLTMPFEGFTDVETRMHLPVPLRPVAMEALLDAALTVALVVPAALLLAPHPWYALTAIAAVVPLGLTFGGIERLPSAAPARWFVRYARYGVPLVVATVGVNVGLGAAAGAGGHAATALGLYAAALTLSVAVSVRPVRVVWTAARPADPPVAPHGQTR